MDNPRCKKVVLSNRAYSQIYSETYSKIRTETGGLLLGHFENGVWYVVEASDPGINATFTTSYHEGDDVYENHICGVISRMYKHPLVFLGMWHRHPGSLDVFSGTDDQTNYKYAESAGNGCISALVIYRDSCTLVGTNIDGDFTLTYTSYNSASAFAALRYQLSNGNDTLVTQDGTGLTPGDPTSAATLTNGDEDIPVPQRVKRPSSLQVRIKPYDTVTRLFSRNTGLLESGAMLEKRAVLVGCGSVGSLVAMELARSGVGKFVLCDTDTLEIHNICRHQCGFSDLGRYKVDAVKDKILDINPNAEVVTYRSIIQRVPEDELLMR